MKYSTLVVFKRLDDGSISPYSNIHILHGPGALAARATEAGAHAKQTDGRTDATDKRRGD